MRWVLYILGGLLFLMGSLYILQGSGVIPVGGMANQIKWVYIGAVVDLVGIVLIVLASLAQREIPHLLRKCDLSSAGQQAGAIFLPPRRAGRRLHQAAWLEAPRVLRIPRRHRHGHQRDKTINIGLGWKQALIQEFNPDWVEIYETLNS